MYKCILYLSIIFRKSLVIERIVGHTNPYQNLIANDSNKENWISGNPKDFDVAFVKLNLASFYHVSKACLIITVTMTRYLN